MPKHDIIDRSAIESLEILAGEGNAPSLLEEVVSTFLQSSPSILDAMKKAFDRGDARAVSQAAHSLKSSSALVGALLLSETCRQIEVEAQKGIDELKALVAIAHAQFAIASEVLNEVVVEFRRRVKKASGQ